MNFVQVTRVNRVSRPQRRTINVAQVENSFEMGLGTSTTTVGTVRTKHATKNLQKVFRLLGFIMPQVRVHRYAYMVYSFLLNSITFLFLIAFGISYWRIARSGLKSIGSGLLLTSFQAFLSILCCELKWWALALTRNKWRAADKVVARLDRRCEQSAEEIAELRLCVYYCNRVVEFFTVCYYTYVVSTFLGAFIMGVPMYNIYLPFMDWRRTRLHFVISAFIEFAIECVACLQQVFNDAFSVIHVWILRTHMKILLLRFSKLGSATMSPNENVDQLKQYIRDHKNYLELYGIIAPIISITIFIQFVVTAFVLSVTFINFMLISTDLYSRFGSFCYVVCVLSEILPLCYLAQCLIDDSNRLAEVIFHSNWIEQDMRYRKMLVFFLHRTQCTKDLIAGKLFPINLSCCLSILKFSFSLYTLIKTMGLDEKIGEH